MSASTALNNAFSKTAVRDIEVDRKIETFGCGRPISDDIVVEEAYHCSTGAENRENERKILQGNCHQGHSKFGASAGKQCVLNSLASLMYSKVKLTKDWNVNDMNVVLDTGNELYQLLSNSSTMQNDYVLIAEIPRQIECFNKEFKFEFNDSLYGLINSNNCLHDSGFQTYTVHEALDSALTESDGAFVTFKANTYIIIKNRNSYCVFDPHSRDRFGKVSGCGNSILLEFNTTEELSLHCITLANSMNAAMFEQFEITGVRVTELNVCQKLPVFKTTNGQFEVNGLEQTNLEIDQKSTNFAEMHTLQTMHYKPRAKEEYVSTESLTDNASMNELFYPLTI
uniref:Peptidase C76 domain-containing protein n=1 Tax=Magallana gigas TaxID=29159 RepID=A0A8W8MDY6_MAGGI